MWSDNVMAPEFRDQGCWKGTLCIQ